MAFHKGDKINSYATYEIIEKLGEGNYGSVFLARQQELGRDVAIKVLLESKEKVTDLQQEGWVQGKLSHPNIVSVYDFAVVEGRGQLVMECVEKPLKKTLEEYSTRRTPVTLPFALKTIKGCMEGLAHAHYLGVVHGDIKPANILISSNGDAKISDFGVARLLGTPVMRKEGSARWAAPEVLKKWKSDKVWACDYQSDLFSMGVVSYVLLTGKHPFVDPSGVLTVEDVILKDEIQISYPNRTGEMIPSRYASMVMKLIQRDKKQRYTSAEEALFDLQERPMMPCPHCGEQNTEDASFCSWCGRNLKSERIAELPPEERMVIAAHDFFTSDQNTKGISKIEELLKAEKINAEKWCQVGYDFNSRGWYKDAIVISTKAIELNEKSAAAYQTRGFAKSSLGEFDDSIGDFTKALDYAETADSHKKSQILYQRGYAYMRLGRMTDACKDARESLKLNPDFEKANWLARKTCRA